MEELKLAGFECFGGPVRQLFSFEGTETMIIVQDFREILYVILFLRVPLLQCEDAMWYIEYWFDIVLTVHPLMDHFFFICELPYTLAYSKLCNFHNHSST